MLTSPAKRVAFGAIFCVAILGCSLMFTWVRNQLKVDKFTFKAGTTIIVLLALVTYQLLFRKK